MLLYNIFLFRIKLGEDFLDLAHPLLRISSLLVQLASPALLLGLLLVIWTQSRRNNAGTINA